MSKKKTTQEFIDELYRVQPGLTVVGEYINTDTKIIVEDELGIQYSSTPFKLLQNRKPSIKSAVDKNKAFELMARLKQGEEYDYSKSEYDNSLVKVEIKCNKHGSFYQLPFSHLDGKGCKECSTELRSNKRRLSNEEFLLKAKKIHGNNFEYLSEYFNGSTKIKLKCKKHNVTYETKPYSHLYGSGCYHCKIEKISKAAKNKNYGWNKTSWVNLSNNKKGSNPKVYLIKCYNDHEEFLKIGRTINDLNIRFLGKREMPYEYEIIEEICGDASFVFDHENSLKRKFKKHKYKPKKHFKGEFECFDISFIDEIKKALKAF